MSEDHIDHDEWNYSRPKLPKSPPITLGSIYGVIPFGGVRNPGFRSSTSHRVWFTFRTQANGWVPEIGIAESAAEAACANEILIDPNTYDVQLQPLTKMPRAHKMQCNYRPC
jgi:hypothetical protein